MPQQQQCFKCFLRRGRPCITTLDEGEQRRKRQSRREEHQVSELDHAVVKVQEGARVPEVITARVTTTSCDYIFLTERHDEKLNLPDAFFTGCGET